MIDSRCLSTPRPQGGEDYRAHQKDLIYNNFSLRNFMHCLIYNYICVSFLILMTISLSSLCVFCIAIAIQIGWYSYVTCVIVLVCVRSIRTTKNHVVVKEHWFNLWFAGVVVKTCVCVCVYRWWNSKLFNWYKGGLSKGRIMLWNELYKRPSSLVNVGTHAHNDFLFRIAIITVR